MFKERSKFVSVKRDKCNYRQVFNNNPDITLDELCALYPHKTRKTMRDCWHNYRNDIKIARQNEENAKWHKLAIAPPKHLIKHIARPQ